MKSIDENKIRTCSVSMRAANAQAALDRAFIEGVVYSIAFLLRQDEPQRAEDLWITLGIDSVPAHVPEQDAGPVREALRNDWGRK